MMEDKLSLMRVVESESSLFRRIKNRVTEIKIE